MRILLDTSAIIALAQGTEEGIEVQKIISENSPAYTSALNTYETKHKLFDKLEPERAKNIFEKILNYAIVLPITIETAIIASDLKQEKKDFGAVDCNTYAVAQYNNLILITLDNDFRGLKDTIIL